MLDTHVLLEPTIYGPGMWWVPTALAKHTGYQMPGGSLCQPTMITMSCNQSHLEAGFDEL
jgi:hypothetical protein